MSSTHDAAPSPFRVTLLTDPLALGGEGPIPPEQTYPRLLMENWRSRTATCRIVDHSRPGLSLDDVLAGWYERVELVEAQAAIVHVGWRCLVRYLLPGRWRRWVRPVERWLDPRRVSLLARLPGAGRRPAEIFRHKIDEIAARRARSRLASVTFLTLLPPVDNEGFAPAVSSCNAVLQELQGHGNLDVIDLGALLYPPRGTRGIEVKDAVARHRGVAREIESRLATVVGIHHAKVRAGMAPP